MSGQILQGMVVLSKYMADDDVHTIIYHTTSIDTNNESIIITSNACKGTDIDSVITHTFPVGTGCGSFLAAALVHISHDVDFHISK